MQTVDVSMTDEELAQAYRNSLRTYWKALGHNKRGRNEARWLAYRAELTRRGLPVPEQTDVEANGVFNGPGSC